MSDTLPRLTTSSATPSRVRLLWLTPANVEWDDRETPNEPPGGRGTHPDVASRCRLPEAKVQ
jgi:hypothetical protein